MQLLTERLILRDFVADDWRDVLAYQRNPLYLRYYEWTEADRTPEAAQEFVGWFLDQQQQEPRYKFQLTITIRGGDGRVIGNCGVRKESPESHEASIGYELAPEHWGKGYATEAARRMARYGFETLGIHRLSSWCVSDNVGSAHVLEKLGMRLEGRLRDHEYYKGRYWDTLLYGMLESEWKAER